jgi:hypothetical protein
MVGCTKELGLSEVIGFLMIVALLSILFSMYLLYVVPLQGRDAEISHMDSVKDEFMNIKLDIDNLIITNRLDLLIQRIIPLGTKTSSSGGSFSFIPLQSYSGSAGTLMVDKTVGGDTINISIMGTGLTEVTQPSSISNPKYETADSISPIAFYANPTRLDVVYNTPSLSPTTSTRLNLSSPQGNWTSVFKVIPKYSMTASDYINLTTGNSGPSYPTISNDLTLTLLKNSSVVYDNLTIAHDIRINTNYSVNLYDWTYGLADSLQNKYELNVEVNGFLNQNNPSNGPYPIGQTQYSAVPQYKTYDLTIFNEIHPLSMLEYSSQNRYWVNQKYQYQWNTLFSNQSDGTSIIFLPPVKIQRDSGNGVIYVNITDVDILSSEMISGSQDTPIFSSLSEISTQINGVTLLNGGKNANYVWIQISSQDQGKWLEAFGQIASLSVKESPTLKGKVTVIPSGSNIANLIIADTTLPTSDTSQAGIQTILDNAPQNLDVHYLSAKLQMAFQSGSL